MRLCATAARQLVLDALQQLASVAPGGKTAIAQQAGIARQTLTRIFSTGKASTPVKKRLAQIAADLASAALHALDTNTPPGTSLDQSCHQYLTVTSNRPRTCRGCETPLSGRQTQWCSDACRKKVTRAARRPR